MLAKGKYSAVVFRETLDCGWQKTRKEPGGWSKGKMCLAFGLIRSFKPLQKGVGQSHGEKDTQNLIQELQLRRWLMTDRRHQRGLLFPFLHFLCASLICLLLVTVRDTQQKRGAAPEMSGNIWTRSAVANSRANYKRKLPILGADRAARRNLPPMCPGHCWNLIKVEMIFHWLWHGKNTYSCR